MLLNRALEFLTAISRTKSFSDLFIHQSSSLFHILNHLLMAFLYDFWKKKFIFNLMNLTNLIKNFNKQQHNVIRIASFLRCVVHEHYLNVLTILFSVISFGCRYCCISFNQALKSIIKFRCFNKENWKKERKKDKTITHRDYFSRRHLWMGKMRRRNNENCYE